MNRGNKIVKIHNGRWKKRLPLLIAILAVLAVFGVLIAINISDEYHTYHSSQATEFETACVEQNGLFLKTSVKKLLGKTYAGFSVSDAATEKLVYQCPDLYPVIDLKSIEWGTKPYTVLVTQRDGSIVTYTWDGTEWQKQK